MNHTAVMFVVALLLAFYGGAMSGFFGAMTGIAIGVLISFQLRANQRLTQALDRLQKLESLISAGELQPRPTQAIATVAAAAVPASSAVIATAETGSPVEPTPPPETPSEWDNSATPLPSTEPPAAPPVARPPPPPNAIEKGFAWLKSYMTTGNVVAKVGVLVLFVGVAFLMKYAVDRNALPIEVRLAGTGLGALALLALGWRLRNSRTAFGLILQGGGIGILYITVFAAARLYHVLPLGFTFALLLALVALSAFLAVLQDARALATIGTIGGFLAPVLTSSGGGSHVALFSYFALLNLGIVGIAWFKAWRILNWVGFMFTFVIAAAWGYQYYQPQYFASTEPFLILSFLFYLTVSVLFAHRHPPQLRGYVDGTLVFGLPLVCFALQVPLVREIEYGRAWTAVGMGAIYLLVARWLWNRNIAHLRMLIESLLALGVVALSLTIPFAFDGHITAAGWALEGAGLIWIGIRQNRPLARAFGVLLQFGAGVAFFAMQHSAAVDELAVLNARYLGSLLIALGALLSSQLCYRNRQALAAWETFAHVALLIWGLLWWFGAGLHEIGLHVLPQFELFAVLLFGALSMAALAQLAQSIGWHPATLATLVWLPVLALIAFVQFAEARGEGPLTDWRWLGWLAGIKAGLLALKHGETVWPRATVQANHCIAWWLCVFILSWAGNWSVAASLVRGDSWAFVVWGVMPGLALVAMLRFGPRLAWPIAQFRSLYLANAQVPVAVAILVWVLFANLRAGDAYPLPFIPLLNPLDLAQLLCLLMVLHWWLQVRGDREFILRNIEPLLPAAVLGGIAFLWLNAATARAVHFIAHVPYAPYPLRHSAVFQGSISVLWGVTALAVMLTATRIGVRKLWITGAALLGMLVLKLFFIDLEGSGTVARIISFMAAGGLMVLIGYLSPAPPALAEERA